jgi:hypothetical protein
MTTAITHTTGIAFVAGQSAPTRSTTAAMSGNPAAIVNNGSLTTIYPTVYYYLVTTGAVIRKDVIIYVFYNIFSIHPRISHIHPRNL